MGNVGQDTNTLEELNIRPRDPARDIRPGCVAIDFGTSSTVVAYETENGRKELMRIGVRDFYERIEPHHFENPTVLEIIDLQALLSEWTEEAYRPGVRWDMVHCSHEAQAKLRDNQSDIYTVSSILTRLKQWALRQSAIIKWYLPTNSSANTPLHRSPKITRRVESRWTSPVIIPSIPLSCTPGF
jgi:hypothetical protein